VVLSLLLIALAITLEPIPLTAFILVLASRNGVRKGAAFIFGWLLSLAVVIAITLAATGNNPPKPSTAPSLAALALGPLTQPWGLVAAGVATITEAKLDSWQSSLALILFSVVATAVYIAMEVYVGFWPEKGTALLGRLRSWLTNNTDQVIIVVSLVIGFWLIGDSIYLTVTS
jgi:hypothetical protein